MPVPKVVMDILKKIKDPHVGKDIVTAKMVKNIKVVGKKVTLTFVPPAAGCQACGMIYSMIGEIKKELDKKGYKVEIEVGF